MVEPKVSTNFGGLIKYWELNTLPQVARWQDGYAVVCKTKAVTEKIFPYIELVKFDRLRATYCTSACIA